MKTIFTWKQQLGLPDCPYMDRWIFNGHLFSIRIHHWRASDDDLHYHDHPWWFVTLILSGGYTDVSPEGYEPMPAGKISFRKALHRHTVEVEQSTWTILLTGPESRVWGFWVNDKFRKYTKYFYTIGHHPCLPGGKRIKTHERRGNMSVERDSGEKRDIQWICAKCFENNITEERYTR